MSADNLGKQKAGGDICKSKIKDLVWKTDAPIINIGE